MIPTHSLDGQHCGQQEGQHGLPGWIRTAGHLLLQTQCCRENNTRHLMRRTIIITQNTKVQPKKEDVWTGGWLKRDRNREGFSAFVLTHLVSREGVRQWDIFHISWSKGYFLTCKLIWVKSKSEGEYFRLFSFSGSGAGMTNGDFQSWQETAKSFSLRENPTLGVSRDRQNYLLPVYFHSTMHEIFKRYTSQREWQRSLFVSVLVETILYTYIRIFEKKNGGRPFSLILCYCSTVTYYK